MLDGGDGRPVSFPVPIEPTLVEAVLDAEQVAALCDYRDRLDEIFVVRLREMELHAERRLVLRQIVALQALAVADLSRLRGALTSKQSTLVSEAWWRIDDAGDAPPEKMRQLCTMLVWALQLHLGPEYPGGDAVIAMLDSLPSVAKVRSEALDELGAHVREFVEQHAPSIA